MVRAKFKVDRSSSFATLGAFVRKQLQLKPTDPLVRHSRRSPAVRSRLTPPPLPPPVRLQFLFVNSSFAPRPDDSVGMLFDCFGVGSELIVNYADTGAWG